MCKNLCVLIAVLLLGTAACSKTEKTDGAAGAPTTAPTQTAPTTAPAKPAPAGGGHAAAGAVPGSHDDWCGEHAVPESLCTRCNPDLVAAFKATGDWCGEHGLPESQCLACNPDLTIVRPPKTEP